MKLQKTFLVLTTLFILLGASFAVQASSASPMVIAELSGDESGDESGDGSGDVTQSGDVDSGDTDSGDMENTLESVALDTTYQVNKNDTLEGSFEATAASGETFNYSVVTEPTHGTLTHEDLSNASFTYEPEKDFVGEDSFTFRLESGDKFSNVATISITVKETEPLIPFYYEDMQQHWANYSASHLAARNYIVGEKIAGDYYYYPEKVMTRGDFLVFLLSIVDPDGTAEEADVTFADADTIPDWLLKKAKVAYNLKILNGVGTRSALYLYPDRTITRSEAFIMLDNALAAFADYKDTENDVSYLDKAEIPDWALQAIKNLSSYKVVQGSYNYINPNGLVTRGQGAELCYKLLKELETSKLTPEEDVK